LEAPPTPGGDDEVPPVPVPGSKAPGPDPDGSAPALGVASAAEPSAKASVTSVLAARAEAHRLKALSVTETKVKRRKKRRKKDKDDTSSTSTDELLFHSAPSFGTTNRIRKVSLAHPGRLLETGLLEMTRFLQQGAEGGGDSTPARCQPVVMKYLITVLATTKAGGVSMRNERELRTISESLDALLAGNLARCGDVLLQRFKAIEASINDATWAVARHCELIPEAEASITTFAEREHAAKLELRERKLRDHLMGKFHRASGGAAG